MKLALAQLAIDGGALDTNRERAIEAIERAGAMDADLVALPELFSVGYFAFDAYERSAEAIDGPTLTALADAAAAADTAVLAGTVIEDLAATPRCFLMPAANADWSTGSTISSAIILLRPNDWFLVIDSQSRQSANSPLV